MLAVIRFIFQPSSNPCTFYRRWRDVSHRLFGGGTERDGYETLDCREDHPTLTAATLRWHRFLAVRLGLWAQRILPRYSRGHSRRSDEPYRRSVRCDRGAFNRGAWQSFASRGRARLLLAEYWGHSLSANLLVTHGDMCDYLCGPATATARIFIETSSCNVWMEWACEQGLVTTASAGSTGRQLFEYRRVSTAKKRCQWENTLKAWPQWPGPTNPSAYDQTGRRGFRPVLRALAPRLGLVYPLIRQARGVVSGSPHPGD